MTIETPAQPPEPVRQKRLVLSLRALMAAVLVLGGGFGWLAYRARIQREAVATILRYGGYVRYNQPWISDPSLFRPRPKRIPRWILRMVGSDYFDTVTSVVLVGLDSKAHGDEIARAAGRLPSLEVLVIGTSGATDASVYAVLGLTRLKCLALLGNDHITPQAVQVISVTVRRTASGS